jgi:hypothetical protein
LHYTSGGQRAAGVPKLPQDSFHGLRRKWVSERKHLPDVDVAKAGGWRSISTMKRSYQLADEAGVLEAVLESRKLRDHGRMTVPEILQVLQIGALIAIGLLVKSYAPAYLSKKGENLATKVPGY